MKPKQVIKSIQKGQKAKYKTQMRFFLSLAIVFAAIFAIGAILDPDSAFFCIPGLGGTTLASMMAIGSVEDVSDKYTSGSNIAYQVYLIDIKQIDSTKPFPKPNTNRQISTLPMLDGQYMQYFEAHDFPTYLGSGEKGDITTTGTNTFSIIMAGNRDQLLNYIEEHTGGKFIILFKEIESTQWEILGSYERPVKLKSFENKNDKDGRYVTFNFERNSINQYYHYVGSIITIPPAAHTAGAASLTIKPGQSRYTIPNGASATYAINAVSGLTASDKGRTITLVGTGTDKAATVTDGTAFVLEDGATWTAKTGSTISFTVMDPTTLIEVRGSRVETA